MPAFDAYVGIDWSGARGRHYAGVAVAMCEPGDAAPYLIAPPQRRWTREAVLSWLADQARAGRRLLAGIDCAFALPPPFPPPPALWHQIDQHCKDDPDLLGSRFALADERFWHRGARPAAWLDHPRPAERACTAAGLGHPQTPLKLIGAKQVGKGALAGARLLSCLHRQQGRFWSVWPFDGLPDHRSVCVEIYPRLFIRMAGQGSTKLRTGAALDAALNKLGSRGAALRHFDDHEADALVSAAGLRRLAADASLWQAGIGEPCGWIFGVPRPAATRA